MITRFFIFLFKLNGWKIVGTVPPEIKKAVVIAAPHTSNWDFIYAMAIFRMSKLNVRYLIKKEMNFLLIHFNFRIYKFKFNKQILIFNLMRQQIMKLNNSTKQVKNLLLLATFTVAALTNVDALAQGGGSSMSDPVYCRYP